MAHIRLPRYHFDIDTIYNYRMNPFNATHLILIPIKLICAPFCFLHFFLNVFFINNPIGPFEEWADKSKLNRVIYWIIKIPCIIIGIVFGIVLIPLQFLTIPGAFIYFACSKHKIIYL